MTPDEADVIIAEQGMGRHIEERPGYLSGPQTISWWCDDSGADNTIVRVRDYHPSRDRNQLHEAEMRLRQNGLWIQYITELAAEVLGIEPCWRNTYGHAALFHMRTAPAEVCAVCLAEGLKEGS